MVFRDHYDFVVVGARVAGAATAMQLAKGGARVLLVDKAPVIGDTLSTHALMRPAVQLLDDWGLAEKLVTAGTPHVGFTHFHYGAERITIPIKPVGKTSGLIAPRRWLIDAMLVEEAANAGADVRLGTGFIGALAADDGHVSGVMLHDQRTGTERRISCRFLIGADGRMSKVAESVRATELATTPRGAATVFGYFSGIPNEGYRWMFSPTLQCGFIPTTGGAHCVFVSCPTHTFKERIGQNALSGLRAIVRTMDPEIGETVSGRQPDEPLSRFAGARGHLRAAAGKGWALVGDAGYFKDPATAHGMTDALLDAHRLSSAFLSGHGVRAYVRQRNASAFEFLHLTTSIGALDWSIESLKVKHARLNALMRAESRELAEDAFAQAA